MKIFLIVLFTCVLSSCSISKLYPTAGATIGGGVGALGGPGTAALGAFAGAATGEVLKSEDEVKEAMKKVEALTSGDVKKLVELELNEHKGWFEKTIDGIYDILMITTLATVLYFIFHFWYGKRLLNQNLNNKNSK